MRKGKSLIIILTVAMLYLVIASFNQAYAAPSATIGFSGNSTAKVGENITVKMYLSNISETNGGVVSAGGNLSFDSTYLEYVSGTGITSPYMFQINEAANYIIAGLDTTLSNGITGTQPTTVFTFVFKVKKKGTTQISLTNAKLSDTANKLIANVSPKVITIVDDQAPPTDNKSNDATLKRLAATGYTLTPNFSSNTTAYTLKVPTNITSVRLEGEANHSNATVTGLGNITLTGNATTATVRVTAEDGVTTKTYTVTIIKDNNTGGGDNQQASDATLKSLDVGGYELSPVFNKDVTTYSTRVKNNITGLNVIALPTNPKANVSISGNNGFKEGVNTITIRVTAEDGTTKAYTVNVFREYSTNNGGNNNGSNGGNGSNGSGSAPIIKSSDNYLKSLTINSSHDIYPSFDKKVTSYNITVPYEVDKLVLNAIANHPRARVKITGNENFVVGRVNIVEIVVTAEDGSTRIYTLNVTRSTMSSDNDLKDLEVDEGVLSPKFDPNDLEYTMKVDSNTDRLNVKAIAKDKDAKVEIIGNENLREGHNNVLVKVTDKNGFVKYYSIDVEKEKKEDKIFGLTPLQFGIIAGIISFLLWLILLFLLLFRNKDKGDRYSSIAPVIEVNPQFNFGVKSTPDGIVITDETPKDEEENEEEEILEVDEENDEEILDEISDEKDADNDENFPYDPYDDNVTKKELIDAINEAEELKDSSKLKMLLQQEALNEMKKEVKRKEDLRKKKSDKKENLEVLVNDEYLDEEELLEDTDNKKNNYHRKAK